MRFLPYAAKDSRLCPKKIKSRIKTIVDPFRSSFGCALPSGLDYLTLCGPLSGPGGQLRPGCELDQIVQTGLIRPEQFVGCELLPEVHAANLAVTRGTGVRLFNADIRDVLDDGLSPRTLNPGIVNLDTTHKPALAVRLLGDVLALLDHYGGDCMLTWNFVIENRKFKNRTSYDEVHKVIMSNPLCVRSLRSGWDIAGNGLAYEYGGTGVSATIMCSVVFVRHASSMRRTG